MHVTRARVRGGFNDWRTGRTRARQISRACQRRSRRTRSAGRPRRNLRLALAGDTGVAGSNALVSVRTAAPAQPDTTGVARSACGGAGHAEAGIGDAAAVRGPDLDGTALRCEHDALARVIARVADLPLLTDHASALAQTVVGIAAAVPGADGPRAQDRNARQSDRLAGRARLADHRSAEAWPAFALAVARVADLGRSAAIRSDVADPLQAWVRAGHAARAAECEQGQKSQHD